MAVDHGLKVCRKCLATEGLSSLFEGKPERLEMFEAIGGIEILKDMGKHDAMICWKCSEELMKLCNDRWKIRNVENLYVKAKRGEEEEQGKSSKMKKIVELESSVDVFDESLASKDKTRKEKASKSEISDVCEKSNESSKSNALKKTRKNLSTSGSSDESNEHLISMKVQKKRRLSEIKSDSKKYECKICNKAFTRPFSLKNHIAYKHENKRRFTCDVCGERFYETYQVRTHMTNNHIKTPGTLDQSRPFKCSQCPKRFTSAKIYKEHQEVTHSDKHPFTCKCGKSFKTEKRLKAHRFAHTDSRPFECYCGKAFKMEGLLKTHKFNIHKSS